MGGVVDQIIDHSPGRRLIESILPRGNSDNGSAPINDLMEQERLRKKREQEAKDAAEVAAREAELAPLNKALRDEVGFLGQKFSAGSKIGGRGLF